MLYKNHRFAEVFFNVFLFQNSIFEIWTKYSEKTFTKVHEDFYLFIVQLLVNLSDVVILLINEKLRATNL